MKWNLFTLAAALSGVLWVATVILWVWSYGPTGAGAGPGPPAGPRIQVMIPSDAGEFLVPVRGRLEWWEYASWEPAWYRMNSGVPMWVLAIGFAVLPVAWSIGARSRRGVSGATFSGRRGGIRGKLLTFAAALSAVFCAATVMLWVWSMVAAQLDFFFVQAPMTSYGLGTERGALIGFLQRERPSYHDPDPADVQLVVGGFRYLRITSDGMRRWNLVLPSWLLTCAFLILPFAWYARRRRDRRRARTGACAVCGYDLRATPERCSECGTVPAKGGT